MRKETCYCQREGHADQDGYSNHIKCSPQDQPPPGSVGELDGDGSAEARVDGAKDLGPPVPWFCWTPDYMPRLPAANHRAAASALSSGRVLKAIAVPGADSRIELMTTSNNARQRGGKRTPAPITTIVALRWQSRVRKIHSLWIEA